MVFDEKIKTAFEVLRNAAQNDFERHRIDVLERDLTSPPVPEVIDDFYQKFDGVAYVKNKRGRYTHNTSVHQAVWRYYHGDIPNDGEKYEIHHDDWNPGNNTPDNLVLKTADEHHHIHCTGQIPLRKCTFVCDNCGKTFETYESQKGRDIHYCSLKCQRIGSYKRMPLLEKTCEYCGKTFTTKQVGARFCSSRCASNLRHSEKEIRICPVCGKSFEATKNHRHIYCSLKCGTKTRQQNYLEMRETRTCVICGAEFETHKGSSAQTCSQKCCNELIRQSHAQLAQKSMEEQKAD